jgi:hypothetical protein
VYVTYDHRHHSASRQILVQRCDASRFTVAVATSNGFGGEVFWGRSP